MIRMEETGISKSCDRSARKQSKKNRKLLLEETAETDEYQASGIEEDDLTFDVRETDGIRKEEDVNLTGSLEEDKQGKSERRRSKRKQRLLEESGKAEQRGVCYLSRIPPHMDPVKLRQMLSQYGEIRRVYLAPADSVTRVPRKRENRKRDGGFQEQIFSEGWVEFTKKGVAKRVANMLNGEQIGGKKRSSFYYDLWNIKYLSKFKWDDLTGEIAYKNAIREQKLALEISAAKRERDFYLSKVDKSKALTSIQERLKKKQKVQQESETHPELPHSEQAPKVIRQFSQKQPVANDAAPGKSRLSKDILAGVFGGS